MKGKHGATAAKSRADKIEAQAGRLTQELTDCRREALRLRRSIVEQGGLAYEIARLREQVEAASSEKLETLQGHHDRLAHKYEDLLGRLANISRYHERAAVSSLVAIGGGAVALGIIHDLIDQTEIHHLACTDQITAGMSDPRAAEVIERRRARALGQGNSKTRRRTLARVREAFPDDFPDV